MATFEYKTKKKCSIKKGRFVATEKDAVKFNGRVFAEGDIIGFQYGDTAIVGRLVKIDKSMNTIYVNVAPKKNEIYMFYLVRINEVYGCY